MSNPCVCAHISIFFSLCHFFFLLYKKFSPLIYKRREGIFVVALYFGRWRIVAARGPLRHRVSVCLRGALKPRERGTTDPASLVPWSAGGRPVRKRGNKNDAGRARARQTKIEQDTRAGGHGQTASRAKRERARETAPKPLAKGVDES